MDVEFEEHELTHILADEILSLILKKYSIEELMKIVASNGRKNVYLYFKRQNPRSVKLLVDNGNRHRYRCDDVICVPVPKRFALLEPDPAYFEVTLKANLILAFRGADERDLYP